MKYFSSDSNFAAVQQSGQFHTMDKQRAIAREEAMKRSVARFKRYDTAAERLQRLRDRWMSGELNDREFRLRSARYDIFA